MAQFTAETVERALDLRVEDGVIRSWKVIDGLKRRMYVIDVFDFGQFTGTLRETYALNIGMRAAQVHDAFKGSSL